MIYLLDPGGDILRFAHDAGIADLHHQAWVRGLKLRVGQGMFGVAVAERRVVVTGDYGRDRSFAHTRLADRFVRQVGLRSLVVAPLVAGDRSFGGLGTFSSRPHAFSDAQVALVRALADHAAAAMANALLIEELERSRREIERQADTQRALREIATRISAIEDPRDVIQQTVDEAARLLHADGARIDLIDPVVGLLRWAYQSGDDRPGPDVWPNDPDETLEQGVSGKAVTEGRVFFTGDYLHDDRFIHGKGADTYIGRVGVTSVMAGPLVDERGTFGALTIYTTRGDAWTDDDAAFLRALGTEAAIALTKARRIEELGQSREALARRAEAEQALREIAARITAIREPSELLQHVVDEAGRLVRADGTILDLVDPESGRLQWAYDSGLSASFPPEDVGARWLPLGVGAAGIAVAEDRVVTAGDDLVEQFPRSPAAERFFTSTGFRSLIAAPVIGEAGPLGALEVYSTRAYAFDEADAALIRSLADQAAIAIQNARLIEALAMSREELARRADAERTLREIAARITGIIDPDEILRLVVESAIRLLGASGGMIDLVDSATGPASGASASGPGSRIDISPLEALELEPHTGVSGLALATGRVQLTGDYVTDERLTHTESRDEFVGATGIRSVIAAPLMVGTRAVGAITIYDTEPSAFNESHGEVLQALADQAAVTISNAQLIEALDRSRDEIRHRADAERALREIAANISSIRDADVILQQTVDEAKRLLDSSDARIDLLLDGRLVWAYTSADSIIAGRYDMDASFEVGEGVAGLAVAERRPVRTADYLVDPTFVHTPAADRFVTESGLRSTLAVPLIGEAGSLGAISVATGRLDAYGDADADLLQALADQAAIAIQNARLIEELERSRLDLARRADTERSLREMAARIAELRDPDELLHRIVDESRRLLGSDGAHLTRMSDDGRFVIPVVVAGNTDPATEASLKTMEFPLMAGINGLAAGLGQPIWTEDYLLDTRIPLEADDLAAADRLGLRGMAAVPLRSPEAGTIGTLAVSYREPHAFAEDELAILKGLADHAAIAMTNVRLYERLRQSESRYRHLVQNSPDLVWSVDAEGRFSFLSDTSERLTGWRPEELLGRHFGALVHDSSRDVAEIDWTIGLTMPQQELRGRLNLLHKDGHPIPAEFIAMSTLDGEGRFAGANGSVRDMTELDRLEQELRASEERYRSLLQSSPDLIWAADGDGRYTFVSDRIEDLLGRRPADVVGHHFSEFIAPSTLGVAEAGYQALLAAPTSIQRLRFSLLHADGRAIPYEVTAVGTAGFGGGLIAVNGVARDVSERDRLEREVRQSEERYRFLVQNAPDIIFSTDAEGRFTYLSETIERITGFVAANLVGLHFSVVIDEGSIDEAGARWAALVADPAQTQVTSLDLRKVDGGVVPVEVSAIGIVAPDGRFAGIHGSARDVTERERLERDLRRQAAELAAGEERAHLARELHDSVTQALFSMTLVTRTTELLLDRDPQAVRGHLGSLRELQREALAEMRALIFELRPGNLAQDGLYRALKTHTAAMQGRIGLPIVVQGELPERLPIEIEDVLYRIAQEGLHNIVKHAGARQVRLELDQDGDGVRLRLADDGRGFDPATVPDGHLGLAGMRARAAKIGARLEVRSRPGAGTTIEVIVPRHVVAETARDGGGDGRSRPPARAAATGVPGE